jgi:DNA topoisomerase IB
MEMTKAVRLGRLHRSDCSIPGIRRLRKGEEFTYLEPDGSVVNDEETLERIRMLAITFRTWHATVRGAVELAREASEGHSGNRAIRAAVVRVSERLGNTPAVCRSSYIDARVFDRFREGVTIELPKTNNGDAFGPRQQHTVETRVLDLIS